MTRLLSEKQFNCLLRRGYSPDELRDMPAAEAWKIIGSFAKTERWSDTAKSQQRPGYDRPQKPRNRNANIRKKAIAAAGGKCSRCKTDHAVKAYPIPGTGRRAVLCRPCRNLVMQAAFLEYVPEYDREIAG